MTLGASFPSKWTCGKCSLCFPRKETPSTWTWHVQGPPSHLPWSTWRPTTGIDPGILAGLNCPSVGSAGVWNCWNVTWKPFSFAVPCRSIADWLKAPDTMYLLDFVKPEFLLLRVRFFLGSFLSLFKQWNLGIPAQHTHHPESFASQPNSPLPTISPCIVATSLSWRQSLGRNRWKTQIMGKVTLIF